MNNKYIEMLKDKYPVLFDYPSQFAVEDGWYKIICDLAEEILVYSKEHNLIIPTIITIKQSYGALYIDLKPCDDYIESLLSKYDAISEITCEICGKKGKNIEINKIVWTLCPQHIKEKSLK